MGGANRWFANGKIHGFQMGERMKLAKVEIFVVALLVRRRLVDLLVRMQRSGSVF